MYTSFLIDMSRSTLQAAQQASLLNMQLAQALLEVSLRLMRVAVENQLGLLRLAGERPPALIAGGSADLALVKPAENR
ncbi:hypothetical protein [Pseudoduganella sp. RAF53_2]|jgi:hypothetical protein|uniref:hypothetical protein n=1 Tax=unclassified Pseudoduganella TaxID=2637179 RepID=UPI003F9A0EC9